MSDETQMTRSEMMRNAIREARSNKGMLEKQVNAAFVEEMKRRQAKGPSAIMTRIRDKRAELQFTKDEALSLAAVLSIDPTPLLPQGEQNELPIAPLSGEIEPEATADQTTESESQNTSEKTNEPATVVEKSQAQDGPCKAPAVSFSEAVDGETTVTINTRLSAEQMTRLCMAIPAYMMKVVREASCVYVQAQVPIFTYQAELIMRAIYGRR